MTLRALVIASSTACALALSVNAQAGFLDKMNDALDKTSNAINKVQETSDKATNAVQGTVKSVQDTGQAVQDTKDDMTSIGKNDD
ncbi:hypothetical protein [Alloalcanivorax xenomutans]|jgi:methyl-accepting chemotaxis protein|uniref:Uncharacterized protein n=1 Tax=Alloalcanivorax xenomutans TaxID=1094342 RepID=A0A9Q3W868_9GAMM|nr:hypothetical protein [Alloalcanivorax xenomutans]ERS11956.1 hypothetical protein Q668_18040 [Alcanivorax sp. PN-3]KYZ84221.1 hypothetical protein A3Q32_09625 [Alcanivorax sp. KX64203]MBA4723300.1 hypothetical protein [Alcanivorax sp.]ARB46912.1 hypothetical protein P40_17030 [Alloalcanivorax xenomutans]MCE7510112.1 hypothetical protein [Alloalcanivorax xenomutans]